MKSLSIFVASSFELALDRIAIGDVILRISEEMIVSNNTEIRMRCWEDFDGGYFGKPTQRGYDENLINPSQVILALFLTRCGEYTKGEIELGKKRGLPIEYLQRETSDELTVELKDYLTDNALTPAKYNNITGLEKLVRNIVNKYVSTHSIDVDELPTPTYKLGSIVRNNKLFSLTEPYVFITPQSFNNLVRQTNEIAKENSIGRIEFHSTFSPDKCDTFIACFEGSVDKQSEAIVDNAGEHVHKKDTMLKYLSVFLFKEKPGTRYVPDIERYCNKLCGKGGIEYFPVEYNHYDTIKLHLLRRLWVEAVDFSSHLKVDGFTLMYKETAIIDISKLSFISTSMQEVPTLCCSICYFDSVGEVVKAEKMRELLKRKVLLNVSTWIEDARLELECYSEFNKKLQDKLDAGDFHGVVTATEEDHIQEILEERKNIQALEAVSDEKIRQEVNTKLIRIRALKELDMSANVADRIVKCYDDIIILLKPLTKSSAEFRAELFHHCNALCMFGDNGIIFSDYDRFYEIQVQLVEEDEKLMARIGFNGYLIIEANLLNGYNRNNKWDVADALAIKIDDQINRFEKRNLSKELTLSEEMTLALIHACQCCVSYWGERRDYDKAFGCQAKASDYLYLLVDINRAKHLHFLLGSTTNELLNNLGKRHIDLIAGCIKKGNDIIAEVENNGYEIDDSWYYDKTVFYRTVSSIYYEVSELADFYESERYFQLGMGAAEKMDKRERLRYLHVKAELYHNHGFMYDHFKMRDNKVKYNLIIKNYKDALVLRRELALYNPSYNEEVAQSLVNIGAIYLITGDYNNAKMKADEAISLYNAMVNPNVFITTQHVYEAKLLRETSLRDKAIAENDQQLFLKTYHAIKEIKEWADANKTRCSYYDTIIDEWDDTVKHKTLRKW